MDELEKLKEATMTINEFRAWLEGFEEGIKGSPTEAQWDKIKLRLEGVKSGEPYPLFQPWSPRPWWPTWTYTATDNNWSIKAVPHTQTITSSWANMDSSNLSFNEASAAYQIGVLESNTQETL